MTNINKRLFTKQMKLADLIHANYKLLYIFPRFGIKLGLGESTVEQVCENKNTSTALVLMICNIYTYQDYLPQYRDFEHLSLNNLMKYLENSHSDYRNSRIPQISLKVTEMVDTGNIQHGKVLKQFCENYANELSSHFDYEETTLFPYICNLLEGKKAGSFSIDDYEKNHCNIEEKLNDFKNILIKYLPEDNYSNLCRDILIDLFLLEEDLNRHTILEDKILISLVEHIENNEK